MRRVVAADNNCLFTALAYLFEGDDALRTTVAAHGTTSNTGSTSTTSSSSTAGSTDPRRDPSQAMALRGAAAEAVAADRGETFSEAVLGKAPEEYCRWIRRASSWGGEVELTVLARRLRAELVAVDVQTLHAYRFGVEFGPEEGGGGGGAAAAAGGAMDIDGGGGGVGRRAYLVFDGAHYDAIVLGDAEESGGGSSGSSSGSSSSGSEQRLFSVEALAAAEAGAVGVAREARDKRRFIDVKRGGLRCLVCQAALTDQAAAARHAQQTGHTNFGQADGGGDGGGGGAGAAAEAWRRSRSRH